MNLQRSTEGSPLGFKDDASLGILVGEDVEVLVDRNVEQHIDNLDGIAEGCEVGINEVGVTLGSRDGEDKGVTLRMELEQWWARRSTSSGSSRCITRINTRSGARTS